MPNTALAVEVNVENHIREGLFSNLDPDTG
jgi:hypothetical protein